MQKSLPLAVGGHQLTVAVTSEFLAARGIEWLVLGDQLDRGNFRTRPQATIRDRASKWTLRCDEMLGQTHLQVADLMPPG